MSRWVGVLAALVATQPGCSFTNEFDVPAVVGAWRNEAFTVNSAGTIRRRHLVTVHEDGTGEAVFYFSLSGDDTDQLYSDTFDMAWARDGGEFLMRLTCRDTTAPVACMSVDMPCSLTSDGQSLICFYAILDTVYTFERLAEEGS